MELRTEDKERIEQEAKLAWKNTITAFDDRDEIPFWEGYVTGAEYATIYERQKEGERCPSLPECYAESKKLDVLEAERTELKSQIKNADVRCQKLFDRTKDLEAECINLKSIADVLATIVDTPEFGKMWPGTAHSLRTKLNSLKTKP